MMMVVVVVVVIDALVLHQHFRHGGRWRKTFLCRVARRVTPSVVPLGWRIQSVRHVPNRLHVRQACGVRVSDLTWWSLRQKRRHRRGGRRELGNVVGTVGEVEARAAARPIPEFCTSVFSRLGAEVAQIDRVKHRPDSCTRCPVGWKFFAGGWGVGGVTGDGGEWRGARTAEERKGGKIWKCEMTRACFPSKVAPKDTWSKVDILSYINLEKLNVWRSGSLLVIEVELNTIGFQQTT